MQDTIAQRKARAIEKLTNDRDAAIARAAQLEADRDEAQNELVQIGELITLDPGESVYHGIQTMIDTLIGDIDTLRAERDEVKEQLADSEYRRLVAMQECDEQKQRADILEHACEKALNELDEAQRKLRELQLLIIETGTIL